MQVSVNGEPVTLRYELVGVAWRPTEGDAGNTEKNWPRTAFRCGKCPARWKRQQGRAGVRAILAPAPRRGALFAAESVDNAPMLEPEVFGKTPVPDHQWQRLLRCERMHKKSRAQGCAGATQLKMLYRDGTTHVIFEPQDFIARGQPWSQIPRST